MKNIHPKLAALAVCASIAWMLPSADAQEEEIAMAPAVPAITITEASCGFNILDPSPLRPCGQMPPVLWYSDIVPPHTVTTHVVPLSDDQVILSSELK